MNDSTRTLNVMFPVPGDGLPADRSWPKSRQIPDEPNPLGYPTRPYWQGLSDAGIPPPDDAKVRAVGILPAKVWAFSDHENRPGRSVQSTGLGGAFYSIMDDRETLPGAKIDGEVRYERTLSGTALADEGWDPAGTDQDPESEPGFDLVATLMRLPPGQRGAMLKLIGDAGNWYGKVEVIAAELGLARTTVSTHLARAREKLRVALADHEPEETAIRPRLVHSIEGEGGRV